MTPSKPGVRKADMETIDFSIFDHGAEAVSRMRAALARFERERRIHVNLEVIPFDFAWTRMVQIALYGDGPAVSEIGSSWLSDMVMMNALRAMGEKEVERLGGEESFLPASWQSVRAVRDSLNSDAFAWAVPWVADTRLVYYRKDLTARAGLPERQAFAGHAELEACLQALREHWVEIPLVLPTHHSRINLHILAGWIWAAGGKFLSEDRSKAIFDSPEALDGMEKFFRLSRYLHPSARRLDDSQSDALFRNGQAAVAISGPWLFDHPDVDPQLREQFAVAVPPGVPFVGGFHLVIWKHARQEEAALQLIEFLAGKNAPEELFPAFSLPARMEILALPKFADHPVYRVMGEAVRTGRSFQAVWMWGMVENRLYEALQFMWEKILADPEADFRGLLETHMHHLVERINLKLGS
jgi:multiple sugar transport system substrate-binding protein